MYRKLKIGWRIIGISAVMIPNIASAVTHTVTAQVSFAKTLTATTLDNADFGLLNSHSPAQYTLSTTGIVSGKTPHHASKAGNIVISGPATQNLDIVIGNYIPGNGITPSNAYCSYDGAAAEPCALSGLSAPGKGKTLRIGLDIAVTGHTPPANQNTPAFDVEMRYY